MYYHKLGINKNTMTKITDFEFPIDESVTQIYINEYFNEPLKKDDIPNHVSHVIFGHRFDQPFKKDDIPYGVTHLILGYKFNQILGLYKIMYESNSYNEINCPNNIICANTIKDNDNT